MIELLLACLAGYLIGSVSFARIVARRVLPGEEIRTTSYDLGGHGFTAEARGFSPAAVASRAGSRAGGLATVGDICKAVVATGLAWVVFDRDAAAAAGVGAVLGHAAPLYHGFRGAFGQSPMIGAALVLSPLGLPVAILGSVVTAFATAEMTWVTVLWPLFLVLWGVAVGDTAFTWFAVAANLVYLWRVGPQVVQRVRYRREHHPTRSERRAEILVTMRTPQYEAD